MKAKFKFKGKMKNTDQIMEGYYLFSNGKHFILVPDQQGNIIHTEVEEDGIELIR